MNSHLELLIMLFRSIKRTQMAITVAQKLESIRKLDKGDGVMSVFEEHEWPIKLCYRQAKVVKVHSEKNVRTGKGAALPAVVVKGYVQQ